MSEPKSLYAAYQQAFAEMLPTMDLTKRLVLQSMMSAPAHTLSSVQLLRLLGRKHNIVINQAIGQLGAQIYKKVRLHPDGRQKGKFQMWTVVATMGDDSGHGFPWQLRREVVRALEILNFSQPIRVEADEFAFPEMLFEGARLLRWVNSYERNPKARALCIAHYGLSCMACGLLFEAVYGAYCLGFIHVHHLRPLSVLNAEYEVDPVQDLVPVCPNCHAAIHMGGVLRSIDEVKLMMQSVRSKSAKTIPE